MNRYACLDAYEEVMGCSPGRAVPRFDNDGDSESDLESLTALFLMCYPLPHASAVQAGELSLS